MKRVQKIIVAAVGAVLAFFLVILIVWHRFFMAIINHDEFLVEEVCGQQQEHCIYVQSFTPFGIDAVETKSLYWNKAWAEGTIPGEPAVSCKPGILVVVSWTENTLHIQSNGGCSVVGSVPDDVQISLK